MARIVLAMSGGVDSSVSAHLLQRAGHEVIGVFMRHGVLAESTTREVNDHLLPIVSPPETIRADHKQGCCSASDAADARRVSEMLGIDFYAVNFDKDFARIVDYFVNEYNSGRTPNPCVMCNNWIKFGRLFDYADSVAADFVATGHYARLEATLATDIALRRGKDRSKDQSYVLFGVDRDYLPRMILPVGEFDKSEIRKIARELQLDIADKRDSQEICFVTSGQHGQFVAQRSTNIETAGEIVTTDGQIVGTHAGYENFTVGQRKGLRTALGEPHYVTRIDANTRRIVIGRREELARRGLSAHQANWLIDPPREPLRCAAQIRYNSDAQLATLYPSQDDQFRILFDTPCYGVAPGQAVVCYQDDRVIGGGWIASTGT